MGLVYRKVYEPGKKYSTKEQLINGMKNYWLGLLFLWLISINYTNLFQIESLSLFRKNEGSTHY